MLKQSAQGGGGLLSLKGYSSAPTHKVPNGPRRASEGTPEGDDTYPARIAGVSGRLFIIGLACLKTYCPFLNFCDLYTPPSLLDLGASFRSL